MVVFICSLEVYFVVFMVRGLFSGPLECLILVACLMGFDYYLLFYGYPFIIVL